MLPRADEYRAHARECEDRAAGTRDSDIKQHLLELARRWRRMADQLDRYGR